MAPSTHTVRPASRALPSDRGVKALRTTKPGVPLAAPPAGVGVVVPPSLAICHPASPDPAPPPIWTGNVTGAAPADGPTSPAVTQSEPTSALRNTKRRGIGPPCQVPSGGGGMPAVTSGETLGGRPLAAGRDEEPG